MYKKIFLLCSILAVLFLFLQFSSHVYHAYADLNIPNPFPTHLPPVPTIQAKITEYIQQREAQQTFDYPHQYPDYYDFARTNLFDEQEFFTLGTASPAGKVRWLYYSADRGNQFVVNGVNRSDWVSAECSGASMAEIFNAYGMNLTTGDVLDTEHTLGVWLSASEANAKGITGGLQSQDGVAKTAKFYGFNSTYTQYKVNQDNAGKIIDIAQNQHTPVMIGAGGTSHWLVLWGADSNWQTDPSGQHLWLLDSSVHTYTYDPDYPHSKNDPAVSFAATHYKMSLNAFIHGGIAGADVNSEGFVSYWNGIAVVITKPVVKSTAPPQQQQQPVSTSQVCAGGDGSGCVCDNPWQFTPQNDYETPNAHKTCADNEYCDPTKTGKGKFGSPCVKVNCSCSSSNHFICSNGHASLDKTCDLGSNQICDVNSSINGNACTFPTNCTCAGKHLLPGGSCRGPNCSITIYDYKCTNSSKQTYSSSCLIGQTCTIGQITSGIPCR